MTDIWTMCSNAAYELRLAVKGGAAKDDVELLLNSKSKFEFTKRMTYLLPYMTSEVKGLSGSDGVRSLTEFVVSTPWRFEDGQDKDGLGYDCVNALVLTEFHFVSLMTDNNN